MHYFHLLKEQYKAALGHEIQIFKPATTSEHWYGFDQAYFTADIPKPEVIEDLEDFIQSDATPGFRSFRAFLLQFKVVEILNTRSVYAPTGWKAPYYRSELYLEPNPNTQISQHESLRRLSGLPGASVAYVCPMIFDENDVVKDAKLSDLQFVDVSTSPNGWLTTERHFIAFQQKNSTPVWCSDPVVGRTIGLEQIIERATPLNLDGLIGILNKFQRTLTEHIPLTERLVYLGGFESNILPKCLSIVAEIV